MHTHLLITEGRSGEGASIRSRLEAEGYRVDVAAGAHEVVMLAELHSYDAILLDLAEASLGGLDLVRQLRIRRITVPLLVLSARGGVEERVKGLDAGADDFLARPFADSELLARLRALMRRPQPFRERVLRVGDLELDRITHHAMRNEQRVALTRREFALLEMLMEASPAPVNKESIIKRVWGGKLDPGTNVVNVYINNLRRKIDRESRSRLIHTVRGVGFSCRELFHE